VGDSFHLLGCDSTNMAHRDAVGVEPSTPSDENAVVVFLWRGQSILVFFTAFALNYN
jgi:hypothetical protein